MLIVGDRVISKVFGLTGTLLHIGGGLAEVDWENNDHGIPGTTASINLIPAESKVKPMTPFKPGDPVRSTRGQMPEGVIGELIDGHAAMVTWFLTEADGTPREWTGWVLLDHIEHRSILSDDNPNRTFLEGM